MAAKMYAWSELHAGGERKNIKTPQGGTRNVVVNRVVFHVGDEVTKSKLKCSEEEWEHLIASGSVRPYPIPAGTNGLMSPHRAVMAKIMDDRGDINTDLLMSIAAPDAEPEESDIEEETSSTPAGVP